MHSLHADCVDLFENCAFRYLPSVFIQLAYNPRRRRWWSCHFPQYGSFRYSNEKKETGGVLTTAQVHEGVLLHHVHLVDDLGHQVEGGLAVHLGAEGLVAVEAVGVGDGVVVDLLQDVSQQAGGGPLVQLHGLRGAFPLQTQSIVGKHQINNAKPFLPRCVFNSQNEGNRWKCNTKMCLFFFF